MHAMKRNEGNSQEFDYGISKIKEAVLLQNKRSLDLRSYLIWRYRQLLIIHQKMNIGSSEDIIVESFITNQCSREPTTQAGDDVKIHATLGACTTQLTVSS
jgi:hypothetical protein